MIRSSKHAVKFANKRKKKTYARFLREYRRVAAVYLDYFWNNRVEYVIRGETRFFDIKTQMLDVPTMLAKASLLVVETSLSARAQKCCVTQVLGILRGVTEQQKKRIYQYNETPHELLFLKICKNKPTKPNIARLNPELNSICCGFFETTADFFDGFFELKSIGIADKFRIPIKFHRQSNKYKGWKLLNSFLLLDNEICFRWEREAPKEKEIGAVVGADQGISDVLVMSDGQKTAGSLIQVMQEICRKRKGSDAVRRKYIQRDNSIRAELNRLDFSEIREVRLELLRNMRKNKRVGAFMSHWTYALIEKKMRDLAETEGFVLTLNDPAFRSQRCNACELVLRSNRNGKQYKCASCGYAADADLVGAINNEVDLPAVPDWLKRSGLSKKRGFYWTPQGFFDLEGVALTVPLSTN